MDNISTGFIEVAVSWLEIEKMDCPFKDDIKYILLLCLVWFMLMVGTQDLILEEVCIEPREYHYLTS